MSLHLKLKRLSIEHGVPVEILRTRWEAGYRGAKLTASTRLPADDTWLSTTDAARMMAITVGTLHALNPITTHAIQRRSRSSGGFGPRGAGWMWLRADCERIKRIRTELGMSARQALRVLTALKAGRL